MLTQLYNLIKVITVEYSTFWHFALCTCILYFVDTFTLCISQIRCTYSHLFTQLFLLLTGMIEKCNGASIPFLFLVLSVLLMHLLPSLEHNTSFEEDKLTYLDHGDGKGINDIRKNTLANFISAMLRIPY